MLLETAPSSSLDRAAETYREMLLDERGASCREYLAARGIDVTAEPTAHPGGAASEVYGLGYVAEPAVLGHEQYVGRLSIAYRTRAGVRGMKFRTLGSEEPKYLGLPGQRPRLYNVNDLLLPTETVAICEGELDTIVASAVVGVPAVGVAGTAMWREHVPRCFAGFERVLVVIDNDDKEDGRNPGRELGERICRDLEQAVVITPPKGMDLTEWVLGEGLDPVRKAMGL